MQSAASGLRKRLFEAMKKTALEGGNTVAAKDSREKLLEMAGSDQIRDNYEIDLVLDEIAQDDEGKIVVVKREVPVIDNSLPVKAKKAPPIQAQDGKTPAQATSNPFKDGMQALGLAASAGNN